METLVGTWKVDRSENFDDFLKAMDVNFMIRKMASAAPVTVTIEFDGTHVTITTVTMKTLVMKFRLGEEFIFEHPMEGEQKTKIDLDGKVLKAESTSVKKGKRVTTEREVINGEMVTTIRVDNVKCVRYFKKVSS